MSNQNVLPRIAEIIQKSVSGSIGLPSNPSNDAVAAGTAIYLGLLKLGKSISLACSNSISVNLTATDKVRNQLVTGGDNLVISLPYNDGAIDKVDYNVQGDKLNLVISPRPGYPKIDANQVKYSYSGGALDFIMTIDAPTLNSLGSLYSDNEKQFQGRDIINIDRHLTNSFFGTANFVNKTISSVSELALKLLQNLQIEIDRDIATNLYAGIASATNNFTSYSVNADTFESIANLLRLGAVKKSLRKPVQQLTPYTPSYQAQQHSPPRPFQPPQFNQPQPIQSSGAGFEEDTDMVTPVEDVEKEPRGKQTPQDWLKPKIFRGGGGLV